MSYHAIRSNFCNTFLINTHKVNTLASYNTAIIIFYLMHTLYAKCNIKNLISLRAYLSRTQNITISDISDIIIN